jgi:O-antigen ligase
MTFAVLGLMMMGFNRTRIADWPLSDLAFLAAFGFMVADVLGGREALLAPKRARRTSPGVLAGVLVLLTAGALSALQSWDPGRSLAVVLRFAWIFLGMFWVIRALAKDREALARLLTGWRVCVVFNALVAISGQLGLTGFSVENSENRQTAFFDQPNELAGLLVTGLPLFLLGVPRRREYRTDGRELLSRAVPIGLVFYAIATTGSMSALLGGLAGVVAMLIAGGWRHVRRPGRAWTSPLLPMLVAFGVLGGLFALFTSDLPVVERFDRLTSGDQYVQGSVDSRETRNDEVIQRFDESLVVGQGFGSFDPNDPGAADAAGAHNMFFRFIFQAGLPGLVGVLMIIGFALQQCIRLLRNTRHSGLHATAVALTAALVSANTFAMFQPTEYQRYYWMPVAMIGALWSLRREEVRVAWEQRQAEVAEIARLPARGAPRRNGSSGPPAVEAP